MKFNQPFPKWTVLGLFVVAIAVSGVSIWQNHNTQKQIKNLNLEMVIIEEPKGTLKIQASQESEKKEFIEPIEFDW